MALIGTLCIMCFFVGAKVGQQVVNKEKIEIPSIPNPVKAYQEYKEEKAIKEDEKERKEAYNKALQSINEYDGY